MKTKIKIRYEDGEEIESSLSSFLKNNSDDPDLCDIVSRMKIGEMTKIGGGSAPLTEITKIKKGE